MKKPDFYLASTEGYRMENPFRCYALGRLKGDKRDDYLLIQVEPPLTGQNFGLGGRDIEHLIIASRYQEDSLFPVEKWPVPVHVARLLISYEGQDTIRDDQMELIAWAEIYPTFHAARAKEMPASMPGQGNLSRSID